MTLAETSRSDEPTNSGPFCLHRPDSVRVARTVSAKERLMQVGPVIAVTDLERARRFYEDALGLTGERSPIFSTGEPAPRMPGSISRPLRRQETAGGP